MSMPSWRLCISLLENWGGEVAGTFSAVSMCAGQLATHFTASRALEIARVSKRFQTRCSR